MMVISSLTCGFCFTIVVVILCAQTPPVLCGCFKTMFSFGDSTTDTGNTIALGIYLPTAQNPYGMTYFYAPNGRYCNGRIIIDFVASAQGLDYLHPYQSKKCGVTFKQGANFAVGGGTVLNQSYFTERNITESEASKYTLTVQLTWFIQHLFSICKTDCRDYLSTSLIWLGEMGGDDYAYTLIKAERSIEEVRTIVPLVVNGLSNAVQTIIKLGGKTIVVPGIYPLGCSLQLLAYFADMPKDFYDPRTGCFIAVNDLVQYHNHELQKELERLRKIYTNTTIVYVDYYNATYPFYLYPEQFGFNKDPLVACCGDGGEYNMNVNVTNNCGPTVKHICTDPLRFVVWDGIHYTEKSYALISKAILSREFLTPPIDLSCSVISEQKKNHGYFDNK